MHPGTMRDLHYTEHSVGVPCHACPKYVYFERDAIVEQPDPQRFFLCYDCHERDLQRNQRMVL